MSLILRSHATPGPTAARPASATGWRDAQAPSQSPTFDEVLFRSLAAGVDRPEQVSVKAAPSGPARRQASDERTDPAELANAIAQTLQTLDNGGIQTTAGQHPVAEREDQARPITGSLPAGAAAPQTAPESGATRGPGWRADPAATALSPGLANTAPAAASVAPIRVLENMRLSADTAPPVAAATPELIAGSAPAPALKAERQRQPLGPKRDDQSTLQTRPDAPNDQPVLAPAAATLAAQVMVSSPSTAQPSSGGTERTASLAQPMPASASSAAAASPVSLLPAYGRAEAAAPQAAARSGLAPEPGLRADPAVAALNPGLPNTTPTAASVAPARVLENTRLSADTAPPAAAATPELIAGSAPAPTLKAERQRQPPSPKRDDQSTLQARPDAPNDQPVLAPVAVTLAAQVMAPSPNTAQPSSGGTERTASLAQPMPASASSAAAASPVSLLPAYGRAEAAAPQAAARSGLAPEPGLRADPAATALSPGLANTAPAAASAAPIRVSQNTRLSADTALPAAAATPELIAGSAPAPALKAERQRQPPSPKRDDQSTLQARPDALNDKPVLASAAVTLAAQVMVPGPGTAQPSSGDTERSASLAQPVLASASSAAAASPASLLPAYGRTEPAAPQAAPESGATRGPGWRADPAATASSPGLADTVPAAASVAPAWVSENTPRLSADTAPPTTAATPELIAGSAPAPALKAERQRQPLSPKRDDQSTLQARPDALNGQPVLAPAAATLAAQVMVPDSGTADAQSLGANASLLLSPIPATAADPTGVAGSNGASGATAAPLLSPEVGSKEWDRALGQQVVRLSKTDHRATELQLNPPGLGPLKVTLHMNDDQMQLMFVSAHASVRAAVEAAVPQLRASLADSGISLGNTSVSSESQAQTAFAQNQNHASRQQAYQSNSLAQAAARGVRTLAGTRRPGDGGVDTYA